MIDPVDSLAFSIQANRGVYAILLGSGISRAARIPTGWEITLDLVRKLALLHGEICEPEPEQWYLDKFGVPANYSDMLDALARTPAERQQLLRGYWEATEQEREEQAKQPTQAHRAIALLVAQGFVKVIVTTNFDRLMEGALNDAGIVPTVLSSPDQVHGALPLIHTQCCVFKVHGDYLDTRIRNTPTELSAYPVEFDQLLDRIFDEFGLVVCGWSADWDEALRAAMLRAPSRRFATYWAVRGGLSDQARRLVESLGAEVVAIKDADSFFQTIQQHVASLEEFSRPHPLSTDVAVKSKRYLTEPRYRIQLADLVDDVVARAVEATSVARFATEGGGAPNTASATARVRAYENVSSTLLEMAPIGGYWAEEPQYAVWRRALTQLTRVTHRGGFDIWLGLERYPGTLLLYALGLGAVESERLGFLGHMFATTIHREGGEDIPAVQLLPPFCLFEQGGGAAARILEGMEKRHAPLNDWLHAALRQFTKRLIPSEDIYTLAFDRLGKSDRARLRVPCEAD